MWNQLVTALSETGTSHRNVVRWIIGLAAFTLLLTSLLSLWSFFPTEKLIFDRPVYNPSEYGFEFLGTSRPNTFLIRILTDWTVYGIGLCLFIGGIYNYTLGKPRSYLIFSFAFLVIILGSIFPSLSISRFIYSGSSPKTYLIFVWFSFRFLTLISLFIAAVFSLLKRQWSLISALFLLFLALSIFTHYNLISPGGFKLLFGKNFLTRSLFYLPLSSYVLMIPLFFLYLKKAPSYFSYTLFLLLFPQISVDLCAIFHKKVVLYSGFNAVHLLEVLSFLLPLIGLTLDHFGFYQKLKGQQLEITRATESKVFFLSSIAEDIQFSLSSLQSYAQELKEIEEVKYQTAVFGIGKSSHQVEVIINNLLSLSAFERKAIVIEKQEVKIREVLEKALKLHGIQSEIQGEVPEELFTDIKRINQIFTNAFALMKDSPFTIRLEAAEGKVSIALESGEAKWKEEELKELAQPLIENQTKDPELLKYQLLNDFSQKIMKELDGSWTLHWDQGKVKIILSFENQRVSP